MTGDSVRFEDASVFVPSRAYAEGWASYTRQQWSIHLTAYRQRVEDLYEELVDAHAASFVLLGPVEILVVVSLVREWVFVRPAPQDVVTLLERWEDPQLARWDMATRADHERRVRDIAAVDDGFTLLETYELGQRFDIDRAPDIGTSNAHHWGRETADRHAQSAMTMSGLKDAIAALTGRGIDRKALASLRGRLAEIRELKDGVRGTRFEAWFGDLLTAHGCEVERGKKRDGEQIDFFVHKPFRAIIECRWQKPALQPRALSDLTGKLGRRPSIVAGLYVSMSGFTEACRKHALHEPNGRTVLLWDSDDVDELLGGDTHALDLFDRHVSDRVRRYKAPDA
ncbi:restriction endonuclease [Embleya sp. NPDC020630]|uniref:restriction endonuclease n=1 Tax=Embleya sp. NPDC020630 TaxID=3363979 RepID=UPI0037AC93A1